MGVAVGSSIRVGGFNFLDYLSDVENGAFPDRNLVIEGGGEHEPLFRNGASLNVVRPNA